MSRWLSMLQMLGWKWWIELFGKVVGYGHFSMILHCLSSTGNICLPSLVLGLMFLDVYVYYVYCAFSVCVSNICVCVYVCVFSVYVCVNSGCWKFIVFDVLSGSLFVLEVCCECYFFYGLCVFYRLCIICIVFMFVIFYVSYVLYGWMSNVYLCFMSPFAIFQLFVTMSIEG